MQAARFPIRISIGSRHDQIEPVQAGVDDALARVGLDEDCRYRIGVAVGEAVANAITHGNRRDPHKRVEVELAITDGEAVVRVVDQGDGFDVRRVGDPTSPDNLLEPGGRGIFLMRSFMGEVVYDSGAAGTEVQLRERFADPAITLAPAIPADRTSGHTHPIADPQEEHQ